MNNKIKVEDNSTSVSFFELLIYSFTHNNSLHEHSRVLSLRVTIPVAGSSRTPRWKVEGFRGVLSVLISRVAEE